MATAKHLWEVDHAYYCNEGNYYSNDCHTAYPTWAAFVAEEGDADFDMNLVFRWDWLIQDADGEAAKPNADRYYRDGRLLVFWVGQRKALLRSTEVSVCQADEDAVRAWLEPRMKHLASLWEPLDFAATPREHGNGREGRDGR